jgi:hypothetical protein
MNKKIDSFKIKLAYSKRMKVRKRENERERERCRDSSTLTDYLV